MYVIVEIAGQQFKAEKGRKLYVHRLPGEENSSVSFDKVCSQTTTVRSR